MKNTSLCLENATLAKTYRSKPQNRKQKEKKVVVGGRFSIHK
jgi:hypothetical protein